jgi:hypothetical protein
MASNFLSTRDGAIEAILAGETTSAAKDGADFEDNSNTSSRRDNFINIVLIITYSFDGLEIYQNNNLILSTDQFR